MKNAATRVSEMPRKNPPWHEEAIALADGCLTMKEAATCLNVTYFVLRSWAIRNKPYAVFANGNRIAAQRRWMDAQYQEAQTLERQDKVSKRRRVLAAKKRERLAREAQEKRDRMTPRHFLVGEELETYIRLGKQKFNVEERLRIMKREDLFPKAIRERVALEDRVKELEAKVRQLTENIQS